jgi:hypothetical protein
MILQQYSAHPVPEPRLGDCYRRIAWADSDASKLYQLLRTFTDTDPYPTRVEPDGDRWKLVIYSRSSVEEQAIVGKRGHRPSLSKPGKPTGLFVPGGVVRT